MKRTILGLFALVTLAAVSAQAEVPRIQSLSVLSFSPDGVLFIGDSIGGQILAIPMDEPAPAEMPERYGVSDVEAKIAALLGTTASEIAIHDMAAHPTSKNVYVSVSRARGEWDSKWKLPNDLADAQVLVRIAVDGALAEVRLGDLVGTALALPNPVAADKEHAWKTGVKQRVDTLTDIAFYNGVVYATGLSNEEFASALWHAPYPFTDAVEFATLETFHGAHGKFETYAPVRTFVPYEHHGSTQILAAYLCTPLTVFSMDELSRGGHVRGSTVAEFGSGNFPLDMVRCEVEGKEFVVLANSMLPLLTFDPAAAARGESITEKVATYTAGVPYAARAANGVQQLDNFDDGALVALQRVPSGKLDLVILTKARLAL